MTNKEQQAFPAPAGVAHITEQGMTLRDYFAAKAMQGLFSSGRLKGLVFTENTAEVAKVAYAMADEMMRARDL